MQEEAQVLFPARSAWLPLSALWVVSSIGILFWLFVKCCGEIL